MIPMENVYHKVMTHFILLFLSFLKIIMNKQQPHHLLLIRLPISYYTPSTFKHKFNFNELHLQAYTTVDVETKVKYQKRDIVRKIVF